ncbi:Acyl-CoA dehydrogenase [Paenibacillus sp. UNC496MF]|uniref:acyl-CoA dehydrogenase family protein n=1 Tax=Paenibacillus sp. UNC496MF TaxID=1502753 RepID=UPI0008EAF54B|nr:acyl-CoA dehydrogenase family protein [Paenibacillus sp. UNC496MF]SFJ52159.1 Acyl-CoA dehydrogenase [Paenibacillus sp. UNC496MF]
MEFGLSEEEQMIRDTAARFAEQEAARRAAAADEAELFDRRSFDGMAELGFAALPWPEEAGGAGGGFAGFALALQELSRTSASLGSALWGHAYLAAGPLLRFGGAEAKRRHLGPLMAGTALGAGMLPGAASASSRLRAGAAARREGDAYVLEGQQGYVLGGAQADLFVVYAETAAEGGDGTVDGAGGARGDGSGTRRRKRYTALLLERDLPGLTVRPVTKKLGLRAAGMAHLTFEGCRVPAAYRLGREGRGAEVARTAAAGARCGLASVAAGLARGAADAALGYARARSQFGKPIAKHQAIAFLLADLETAADAARLLALQAAWRADAGEPDGGASALALRYAADAAMNAGIQAVQVYGGYGYMKEYPVERYMRDAKAVQMFTALDRLPRTRRGAGKGGERSG